MKMQQQAPFAEYEVKLPAGQRTVEVICTPTHRIHEGRGLRYAISFGDEASNDCKRPLRGGNSAVGKKCLARLLDRQVFAQTRQGRHRENSHRPAGSGLAYKSNQNLLISKTSLYRACVGSALSVMPKAWTTLRTVANSGFPSGERAL